MWQSIYAMFTTHAGMYIGYLIPISYLIWLVVRIVREKQAQNGHLGPGDLLALLGLLLVTVDFVYYGYLFFSGTGKLLPPTHLLLKYTGGTLIWGWILAYCYQHYFTRKAAGTQQKARYAQILWVVIGTLVLGSVGIAIS